MLVELIETRGRLSGRPLVLSLNGEALTCECYSKIRQTFARLLPVPASWA
jgi:hypothetical protein